MRLALISLFMLPLVVGCSETCKEACKDQLDDCREGGTPSIACESQHKKCRQECEQKRDDREDAIDVVL